MDTKIPLETRQLTDLNAKFLGLFLLYLGLFAGLAQIPDSFDVQLSRFTASAVNVFWNLLHIPVSSSDTQVTFFDFSMEIIFECTGFHYVAIFSAAVFALPGRTVLNKTTAVLTGTSVIFLLNLLRLGMLGMAGHYFAGLFSFMHLYLWHALFPLVVLLLWILWINGKIGMRPRINKQILIVVAAASLSFWFLFSNIEYYFSFLAFVANGVFAILGGIIEAPNSVIVQNRLIAYVAGEYIIYSKTGLYTLNLSAFFALAAVTARSAEVRVVLKRFLTGICFMICCHLGLLVMDWLLELTASTAIQSVLIWSMVLLSMVAPALSWSGAALIWARSAQHR